MLRAVDHLVIAVPDLVAAIKTYRDLGFTVTAGGRHTGVGTDNALIPFRDGAYLELVGFNEPRPDHRWWAPLQKGGGLVDFCLQTDDFAGDAAVLRRAGVQVGEPQARHRARPDGVEVRWTCALAQRHRTAAWRRSSSRRRPGATSACPARSPTPTAPPASAASSWPSTTW